MSQIQFTNGGALHMTIRKQYDGLARLRWRGQRHEQARERRETDRQVAGRVVREWLSARRWSEKELEQRPKGDAGKAELARLLRRRTPMLSRQ